MYKFEVISHGYALFSTNEYNNFIDLVNNTKFDFNYPDSKGYDVILYYNNKVLSLLK